MKARILITVTVALSVLLLIIGCGEDSLTSVTNPIDMPYTVEIDPADFKDSSITGNTFFPMIPGTKFVYVGKDEDGAAIRVEDSVTFLTKVIMGVTCVVVSNMEWEDGELIEVTADWYAQDKQGNVWYFGEDSKEMEDGQVVSTAGSWEAGVDGALPGIIMLAYPIEGLWYRQEYYKGEAEDVGQVLSLNASVTVPYGTYDNCLQTAEWNNLEPEVLEHKFYAAGVGMLRAVGVEGGSDYEDLTEITRK